MIYVHVEQVRKVLKYQAAMNDVEKNETKQALYKIGCGAFLTVFLIWVGTIIGRTPSKP